MMYCIPKSVLNIVNKINNFFIMHCGKNVIEEKCLKIFDSTCCVIRKPWTYCWWNFIVLHYRICVISYNVVKYQGMIPVISYNVVKYQGMYHICDLIT
jgi:hypothetical protein